MRHRHGMPERRYEVGIPEDPGARPATAARRRAVDSPGHPQQRSDCTHAKKTAAPCPPGLVDRGHGRVRADRSHLAVDGLRQPAGVALSPRPARSVRWPTDQELPRQHPPTLTVCNAARSDLAVVPTAARCSPGTPPVYRLTCAGARTTVVFDAPTRAPLEPRLLLQSASQNLVAQSVSRSRIAACDARQTLRR